MARTARGRKLPPYVTAVRRKDGSLSYRSWIPLGAAGAKKWTRLVDDPETALQLRIEAMKIASELPRHVVTFAQAVENTKREVKANNREGHFRWFECHTKLLLAALGEGTLLEAITPQVLERFKADRLKEGDSPSTIRHRRAALSMIVNHAIRRGDLRENPLKRVRWPKVEAKEAKFYTGAELRELLAKIRESDRPGAAADHDVIAILFGTGLRLGELARLRVDDVDLQGKACVWVRGKARNERVPLGPEAVTVVRRMLERAPDEGPLVEGGEREIARTFRRWRTALKTPRLTPHAMRHSFITALVDAGHPVQVVQRLARHKTVSMTMRYYHGRTDEHEVLADLSLGEKPAKPQLRAVQ